MFKNVPGLADAVEFQEGGKWTPKFRNAFMKLLNGPEDLDDKIAMATILLDERTA